MLPEFSPKNGSEHLGKYPISLLSHGNGITKKINVSEHFCMFLVFSMSHERSQTKDQTRRRHISILGSSSKPRRQQQQKRHQTKGLMRKTIDVHVCYRSLYISLPSSAKQQREMTAWSEVRKRRRLSFRISIWN